MARFLSTTTLRRPFHRALQTLARENKKVITAEQKIDHTLLRSIQQKDAKAGELRLPEGGRASTSNSKKINHPYAEKYMNTDTIQIHVAL
mmetsp:Transcript_38532/g.74763  ORF Transcript_38532/g.74763 Transcript_38532/m.74763 type:complete len:90 (-) Transcript_38532:382-651(-)